MQSIEQKEIKEESQHSLTKEKKPQVNKIKTEEYYHQRDGQIDWKRCKYLGSLLDTEKT